MARDIIVLQGNLETAGGALELLYIYDVLEPFEVNGHPVVLTRPADLPPYAAELELVQADELAAFGAGTKAYYEDRVDCPPNDGSREFKLRFVELIQRRWAMHGQELKAEAERDWTLTGTALDATEPGGGII